jgi:hypothetical protein
MSNEPKKKEIDIEWLKKNLLEDPDFRIIIDSFCIHKKRMAMLALLPIPRGDFFTEAATIEGYRRYGTKFNKAFDDLSQSGLVYLREAVKASDAKTKTESISKSDSLDTPQDTETGTAKIAKKTQKLSKVLSIEDNGAIENA